MERGGSTGPFRGRLVGGGDRVTACHGFRFGIGAVVVPTYLHWAEAVVSTSHRTVLKNLGCATHLCSCACLAKPENKGRGWFKGQVAECKVRVSSCLAAQTLQSLCQPPSLASEVNDCVIFVLCNARPRRHSHDQEFCNLHRLL